MLFKKKLSPNFGKFTVSIIYLFISLTSPVSADDWMIEGTHKDIPRWQRRGAIIVLGMFAAPKPQVVAEHIETLLKIGLGPHGKVNPNFAPPSSLIEADARLSNRRTSY